MNWFKRLKTERAVKRQVIDTINEQIALCNNAEDDVETLHKLLKSKRDVKMNGIEVGDALKVVANIAVVTVIVGFELSHIMNQKGSRFIKTL